MATQARRLRKPTTGNGSQETPATVSPDHESIARIAYLHWLEKGLSHRIA